MNFEYDYKNKLREVYTLGYDVKGRNGMTRQMTNLTFSHEIYKSGKMWFPALTGRRVYPKSMIVEAAWLLSGMTNTKWLNEHKVKIWDLWADGNGDLGPVYGHQVRNFHGVDQLAEVIYGLKKNPYSRRHLVVMWNPIQLEQMKLPPCHYSFQFVVCGDKFGNPGLDCVVSMRSLDMAVGLPYDMGLYTTILCLVAKKVGIKPNTVHINAAAAHIYHDHEEEVRKYLSAGTRQGIQIFDIPKLDLDKSPVFQPDSFVLDLKNYRPSLNLKLEVLK